MRTIIVLVLLLTLSVFASAQTTAVSATITDSDGQAWFNGTWQIQFIPNPGYSGPYNYQGATFVPQIYAGVLNNLGAFSFTIPDNNFISPSGTKWQFTICPYASAQCGSVITTVTGATQNFTSLLSAGVKAPRFSASPNSYGYSTVEVSPTPLPGGVFYNVTLSCQQLWSGSTFSCGGGGGGSGNFAGLGGGTNNSAAMVVGTGSSLSASGSGTITATGVPWTGITAFPVSCGALQYVTQVGTTLTCANIFYQTNENNGSALPQEKYNNAVPPLVAADNAANFRTDWSITGCQAGASHSAGILGDPGVSPNLNAFWRSDCTLAVPPSANLVKPDPSSGLQYVATTCAGGVACVDTNDGLSWGTAKLSPYAALTNGLPGGSTSPPTAGHGIVYISSDPINGIAFGGPVVNQGWWMFGSTDPNYTAGLNGWMRVPANGLSVTLECAAPTNVPVHVWGGTCLEFWGGHADNVHPAVWLNGFSNQATLRGFTFNFESNPIKLGIDSNNNRATGGVSSVWLDKDAANMGNCYSGIGAGPAVDIGGSSFWIKISDSSYTGCVTQAYNISSISRSSNVVTVTLSTSGTGDIVADGVSKIIIRNVTDSSFNGAYVMSTASGASITFAQNGPNASSSGGNAFPYTASAIGINSGTGAGAGFIYANNVALSVGSIWAQGGFNGVGLSANQLIYEGDGSHGDMSVVEFLPSTGFGDTTVYVNDVQPADNSTPICGVESFLLGAITSENALACGPLTNIGGSIVGSVSALRQGMGGIFNGRGIASNIDAGRRVGSPFDVRYPSIVPFAASAGWTTTGLTVTSVQGPFDGASGTSASKLVNSTGGTLLMNFGGQFNATPQLNSFYLFGVWLRSETSGTVAPGPNFNLNSAGAGVGNFCQGGAASVGANVASARIIGDGEWEWFSGVCYISTNPSSGNQRLDMNIPANTTIDAYGPVLAIIPAGSIVSQNEAYEIANTMQSYSSNAAAGDMAMMPGQRFAMATPGNLFLYFHIATPTANRTITWPDFSGTVAMFNPSGKVNGDCTNWSVVAGVITLGDAGAACGSGGGGSGTITNALLNSLTIYTGAGTTNQVGGVPGPISPASVPQYVIYNPNGTVSGAPSAVLAGLPGRSNGTATDAFVATDRNNWVFETFAGTVNVSISQAIFGSSFAQKVTSYGASSNIIVTPSAGTCNTASTCSLFQGQSATFASIDGTNLVADIHDPPIICSTGLVCTRGNYNLTLSAPNAGNVFTNTTNTFNSAGTLNGAAMSTTTGLVVPSAAGAIPTSDGAVADNTTNHTLVFGSNGTTQIAAVAATGTSSATACTNQVITAISGVAVPTCSTITNAMLTIGTTVNGVGVTLGSNTDLANGTGTAHGIMVFEGPSSAFATTTALANNVVFVGKGASNDPGGIGLGDLTLTDTASDSGVALNTLAATLNPALISNGSGKQVWVLPNSTTAPNTVTNPTLNVNGLGAQTITRFGTGALVAGDIVNGVWAHFISDGTRWQLINPQTVTGGSATAWSSLLNAGGPLLLANAGNASEFDQTSAVIWTWKNTSAATVTTPQNAPQFKFISEYWNGSASANDPWTIGPSLTAGTNGASAFVFSHTSGSSGTASVNVPSLLATGIVDGLAPITITTSAAATLGTYKSGYTFNQDATASTAITYTLPTAAAGLQYCVGNSYNGTAATTGTLEILTSASGQFIIFTDGTLSATGGFVQSGGAAGDAACVVGVDATHWQLYVNRGTWTKH